MRTLATQVRLRRLLRVQAEAAGRLELEPENRDHTAAVVGRLLELCAGVRQAWNQESASAPATDELAAVRRHVSRSLSAIEASVAALEVPGADVAGLSAELRETVVPLVFVLRGLEDASLARTA